MSKAYAVFYSPGVEQGAQLLLLKAAFKECKLDARFYRVSACERVAPKAKADVLVAAGGDGTVNSVGAQAFRLHKPLGIVPMGTLNHFAKDLGLPLVPLQAVEVLAKGKIAKVDIGTTGEQVFLNNASLGMYPALVRRRTRLQRYIGKWPAVAVAIAQTSGRRLHLYRLRLTLDASVLERRSSLLFVGNNHYDVDGTGLPQRNGLWGGQLHIFILKTKRIDRMLKIALYMVLGKRLPERYIERFSGTDMQVAVQGRRKIWLAYDGETTQVTLPLHFQLAPRALSVIVPVTTA